MAVCVVSCVYGQDSEQGFFGSFSELEHRVLEISGEIPSWLSGTFVQNGPARVDIRQKNNQHWFDGPALLHSFVFDNGAVAYTNKFLRSDVYDSIFKYKSLAYEGFYSYIPRFVKFKNFFYRWCFGDERKGIKNANVNVTKIADAYLALTEVPYPVQFDLKTLETKGNFVYQDNLPTSDCWESAHPFYDAEKKETVNYMMTFGKDCYYICYRIEDGSSERKVIAKIPVDKPAYMHSCAVTQDYIILTEFPLVVNALNFLIYNQGFIKNFAWEPKRGTRFTVINRSTGAVEGTFLTKAFFAFHHVNAFQKDGVIHVDVITYQDAAIVTGESLLLEQLEKENNKLYASQLKRFFLSLETGEIKSSVLCNEPIEFPNINNAFCKQPYTYVYVANFKEISFVGALHKIDVTTRKCVQFSEPGCWYGEPTFIARPGAAQEDDGVVIALMVNFSLCESFLLVLDGKNFKEIGRARLPQVISQTLHGKFFS